MCLVISVLVHSIPPLLAVTVGTCWQIFVSWAPAAHAFHLVIIHSGPLWSLGKLNVETNSSIDAAPWKPSLVSLVAWP
jgi:hypothetical protein